MVLEFEDKMAEVGDKALDLIKEYFDSPSDNISSQVERAFKFIQHPIKVMHMKQVRALQERSQAIRLLKFLPTEEDRQAYIRMTQPQAAPLLEHRPKK